MDRYQEKFNLKFCISEIDKRSQFANRKSVSSTPVYQSRFCLKYFNIKTQLNVRGS